MQNVKKKLKIFFSGRYAKEKLTRQTLTAVLVPSFKDKNTKHIHR